MGVTPRVPMKLTVGPLPPAVYWRRRAAVLGVLLLIGLGTAALFSGGGTPSPTAGGSGPGAAGGTPSATPALLTPVVGDSPSVTGSPAAATGPVLNPATVASQAAATPCTDSEILLTPAPEPSVATAGTAVKIVLKIKNISTRTCTRDVGSGPQELQIRSGSTVVWSSDYCQGGAGGHDVRTFGPGIEATFYVTWDGNQVGPGCVNGPQAQQGTYQIVARLGTKISSPVPLVVQGQPS